MTQSRSDQRRPFLSAPSPNRYFAAGAIEDARLRIVRAIARNEGPAIVVGGAGTGKSLLLAVLAEQFGERVAVVTLMGAQLCTRRALLQMILCELGLRYRGMDEGELRLAILQHLRGAAEGAKPQAEAKTQAGGAKPRAAGGARRLVLLVDEADSLPIRLLEELRVLTNIAAAGAPLVSLVLAGGPILEERFADPQLDKFAQRLAARCYLAPLCREETLQYVRSQVAAAGIKPERLFADDALEAIHSATGGVPRLINQLGDQLSWMAEETGVAPLDAALVQQAWSDLQQLPAPWNTAGFTAAAANDSQGDVIEFGELDGVDEDVRLERAGVGDDPARYDSGDGEAVESDDELPASIPIATARTARGGLPADEFDVTFAAAEQLLDSLDQFAGLEIRAAKLESEPGDDFVSPAAENPFDEPFDEEEIVLDPYAAFESELLRTAPQVVNRLDRAFAGELHRCVLRAVGKQSREADSEEFRETVVSLPVSLSNAPPSVGDLLVIEDDEQSAAAVVSGKQFRRLFSRLEAGSRSLLG